MPDKLPGLNYSIWDALVSGGFSNQLQQWKKTMRIICDHTDENSWWEYDARGIELCKVCERCRDLQLAKYRPDVLTDPNYWHDEPIDEED